MNVNKNSNVSQSFQVAIEGIMTAIKQERNIKIHLVVTSIVFIVGIIKHINIMEWLWLLQAIALVISSELMNTAIEEIVDEMTKKEYYLWAKKTKDIAAGAVLLLTIYAIVVGLIIFLPKLF